MLKSKYLGEFFETETTSWALSFKVLEDILEYPRITKSSNAIFSKFSSTLKFAILALLALFSMLSILTEEDSQLRFDSALSFATGLHVSTKFMFLWLLKTKREKLSKYVIKATSSLYTGNEHFKEIGKKYRQLSLKVMAIAIIVYCAALIAYNTYPLFVFDKWKLPLHSPIYGITYQNHPGYEISYLFVVLQFLIATPPCIVFDVLFCLYCLFTVLMFELCKISCLNIGDKTGEYNTDEKQRQNVQNIVEMHSAALEFLNKFREIFEIVVLANISTFILGTCLLLAQIASNNLLSAYFGLCVTLIQLLLYSLVGQMIISKKDEFADAIYCSKWYEIKDIFTRKMVLLILMNAQKGESIQLKGFMELSLETYCEMLKACYSFAAFLLNMM